jgi:hypothetical protein
VRERLVHFGRTLQSRVTDFFEHPVDADATPLEIVQAVLDLLEQKVQPIGRGRRVFPYNRVRIRIGPTAADRPALESAFQPLEARLRERLRERQCEPPAGLDVQLSYLERAPVEWRAGQVFAVECTNEPDAVPAVAAAAPPRPQELRLAIVRGAATQESYSFTKAVVCIGRTPEPIDERGRMRRNDVVFLDTIDGITETVGRAHARLELDPASGDYRIFNEGSSNPTFIVRDGSTIQIPPRDPRGMRVRSGDELQLGRALIRLVFEPAAGR